MTPLEVCQSPPHAEQSLAAADRIVDALVGQTFSVGIASLFAVFVSVCQRAGSDAGREFEALLSALEDRREATHRGSAAHGSQRQDLPDRNR